MVSDMDHVMGISPAKGTMNNTEYSKQVEAGAVAVGGPVPIDPGFVDERGAITNLLLSPLTSVAQITSKRGSVRANHVHKTDWHYAFVATGKVLYFERDVGSTEIGEPTAFGPGEMFYTPPNREHAMLFAEDSVIFTFAKNVRDHETHEADLVRVTYITPEIAARFVAK